MSHILALAERDEKSLAELAKHYATGVAEHTDRDLAHICFNANVESARFINQRAPSVARATVVASTIDQLRARLIALAEGKAIEGVHVAGVAVAVARPDPLRIAFLFTGQGAQYPNMAKGLYDNANAPAFRAALDRCAEILAPHLEQPLLPVIFSPSVEEGRRLNETQFAQPALFAVEYALTELWRSWGITPNVVMGHSVGEFAAACIAGVMSLEDALRLIAKRGRLMQSLPSGGKMAAIFAPEKEVALAIASHREKASIAAVNTPTQTVISGDGAAIDALCQDLSAKGVRSKELVVSHAFHSPLLDPVLDAFEREAASVTFAPPHLPLISNLTGRVSEAGDVTPKYWRTHAREAVRFADGLATLAAMKPDVVIEIGPHATLLSFVGIAFGERATKAIKVASLRKGEPDWEQMLEAVSSLYLAGADIDFRKVMPLATTD